MDTAHLEKARDLLFPDGENWCGKGARISLVPAMPIPNVSEPKTTDRQTLAVRAIYLAESNMLTAMERLEWMRGQAGKVEHIKSRWRYYAGADIEYWHVQLRSSLDQVAFIISSLASLRKKKKLDVNNFSHLCRHATPGAEFHHYLSEKLAPGWLALLQGVNWFDQIVSVRNELVHRGGQTLVFGYPSDGILFQVHGRLSQRLVRFDPLMHNDNVVYFDRYGAYLMAHLIVLLEEFATLAHGSLGLAHDPAYNAAVACHPGYGVLHAWIGATLAAVGAS